MQLINKFTTILFFITASAVSVRSVALPRHELAELSVVLYDDVNETGASFSPDTLVQGVCNTLPPTWLDRAECVVIGSGFSCEFFEFQGCQGPSTALSGTVGTLPGSLYNNVESFFCSKAI